MKATTARRKGVAAESAVRGFLHGYHGNDDDRPWLVCERIPAGAADDRGDLVLIDGDGDHWCLEIKAYTDTGRAVTDGMRELPREQENAGAPFGAVVVRPRGVTDPRRWFVVMELQQFAEVVS